jgi:SAM-dependent methyltransferase
VTVRRALGRSVERLLKRAPDGGAETTVMKRDWDARARENAMHYIVSDRLDWELDEFLASGRQAYDLTIADDLELVCAGRAPSELRVLEIGCGIGRMTRALADVFGEVHGVDVSGEMVARARELLVDLPNAHVHETDGRLLAPFADGSFDFGYSFIVFQHVPYADVVVSYLRETHRTLRPGGLFKFQVNGFASRGERDTWDGVGFTAEQMRGHARAIGFEVVRMEGGGTQYFWQVWRKEGG